ncbi:AP-4 complex accessory subunit RUSC2 [Pholidichthys leucotaenia]
MIGASNLSGDTLIACHFPVVQLPTWQLPIQALCDPAKRSGRLCPAGLTRAVSLPEQDSLDREHTFVNGRRHLSNSYGSLNEDRAEEEGTSDSSGRYDSTSSPEETSSHARKEGGVRSHNSFLPCTELNEDEDDDDDSDGDNLHRYHEDSSFVLHGNSNWPLSHEATNYTVRHEDLDSEWGSEGTMLGTGSEQEWLANQPNQMDSLQPECRYIHLSGSGVSLTAYLEHGLDGMKDKMSPELLFNTDYISDSSCNSSDGILVNFCSIYNKSNNPATPHDLSSPAAPSSDPSDGSIFLNLQPVPQSLSGDVHCNGTADPPAKEEVDMILSASSRSPRGLDSNCNLYSLEPLSPGLSSLEVSDLTACLQSQATLAMETNQKYYKLVTCDLSSQSPSPAWSSLTSCPEGQRGSSSFPSTSADHKNEGQHKEANKEEKHEQKENRLLSAQSSPHFNCSQIHTHDPQAATTFADKGLCRRKRTDGIQSLSHSPASLCPSMCSPHSRWCQDARSASTQPSVIQGSASEMGLCSLQTEVVRYSKAQRPTSLPIQPFVLSPKGQQQSQHLGCLLEQYMNQKSSKTVNSQPGFKFKEKSSQSFSNLQPPSVVSQCPVFLEAPSSSDTCSTCTPSPECFSRTRAWGQSSQSKGTSKSRLGPHQTSLTPTMIRVWDKNSPCSAKAQSDNFTNLTCAPNLVRIPTFQDLISLTSSEQSHASPEPRSPSQPLNCASCYNPGLSHMPPTLPLTFDTHHPNLSRSSRTTLTSREKTDSGFFHSCFSAAVSSVAPLSSLSSLLSGLQIQDSGDPSSKHHGTSQSLSDRHPTEFCISPDTSYESMSISDLQRRGLLRSVSRAVDLIMAHFGSSRDPEEKMRLGNSSCSPTIAGLVLEHLCPTIQNILEDGLRDHKLDFIIGQRRNHSWSVVETSTRMGPSTRVLHSLVSKIRLCPQLSNHCMRLRAFIMGLLNLRALEFWLSHLLSQKDVITTYYHSWGFLSMSMGQCQPLFQELLLLLQPLSVLPFDLSLLLEPRLLRYHQLRSGEQAISPLQPCSALLVTSWPRLQADRNIDRSYGGQISHQRDPSSSQSSSYYDEKRCDFQANRQRSPFLAPIPEWCPKESDSEVTEVEDREQNRANAWFQISMDRPEKDCEALERSINCHAESQGGLRWAKLFGAADPFIRAEAISQSHIGAQSRRHRRPSQWLHLDRSQLGLLAQSIRSMKFGGAQASMSC